MFGTPRFSKVLAAARILVYTVGFLRLLLLARLSNLHRLQVQGAVAVRNLAGCGPMHARAGSHETLLPGVLLFPFHTKAERSEQQCPCNAPAYISPANLHGPRVWVILCLEMLIRQLIGQRSDWPFECRNFLDNPSRPPIVHTGQLVLETAPFVR